MEALVVPTGSGAAGTPAHAARLARMELIQNPATATTQLLQVEEKTARGAALAAVIAALTVRTALLVRTHLIMVRIPLPLIQIFRE